MNIYEQLTPWLFCERPPSGEHLTEGVNSITEWKSETGTFCHWCPHVEVWPDSRRSHITSSRWSSCGGLQICGKGSGITAPQGIRNGRDTNSRYSSHGQTFLTEHKNWHGEEMSTTQHYRTPMESGLRISQTGASHNRREMFWPKDWTLPTYTRTNTGGGPHYSNWISHQE